MPALRTWIEISRSSVLYNIRKFLSHIDHRRTQLMAVVKSNAYGHNIHDFGTLAVAAGADRLGVDSIVEAITLRDAGLTCPILVLGFTMPENYVLAEKRRVAVTISSFAQLDALIVSGVRNLHVHIKVDTGMGRQGFLLREAYVLAQKLQHLVAKGLVTLDGLYTHFAGAKDPNAPGSTHEQFAEFGEWRKIFHANELHVEVAHCAASAATLLYPPSHCDMVRVGMGVYGYFPSQAVEKHFRGKMTLRPVLSWRSIVSEVKDVPEGSAIGYDGTCVLSRESRIAVVPVGYWHGFPRLLSNKARVIVGGKFAPVIGRVSMDMISIDVTDIPNVFMGSIVTLLGRDGECVIDAREHAKLTRTTPYEVVTRLNPLIERRVVD